MVEAVKMYVGVQERCVTLLRIIGIFFVYVFILAGRFSIVKVIDNQGVTPWLQLQLWGGVLAGIVSLCLWHLNREKYYALKKEVIIFLCALFLFLGYFLMNAVLLGNAQFLGMYVNDVLMVLPGVLLITFFFQTPNDLIIFSKISECFGVGLFIFALFGFGNQELNGVGWAPFGGPFTFARLEFLTCCSGFYLAYVNRTTVSNFILHLSIAGIGLFSVLASQAKAAFLGVCVVILFNLYWDLVVSQDKKSKNKKLAIAAIVGVCFVVFFTTHFGQKLAARTEAIGSVLGSRQSVETEPEEGTGSFPANVLKKAYAGVELQFEHLTVEQQKTLRAVSEIIGTEIPKSSGAFVKFLESIAQLKFVLISDLSARMRLFLEAVENYQVNKWCGIGVGNYHLSVKNMYYEQMINEYYYPHNIILELLATTGRLGVSLFMVFVFSTFVLMHRLLLRHPEAIYTTNFLIFTFVVAQFSGNYFDFRLFWYISLILLMSYHGVLKHDSIMEKQTQLKS